MPDRRSVDDLTIEELEQILRIKRREARLERLRRYEERGRRLKAAPLPEEDKPPAEPPPIPHTSALTPPADDFPILRLRQRRRRRAMRDNLLLIVELIAVGGLVAILVFAATALRDLNRETIAVQAEELVDLPTPTATPIISAVVLPSGHTPPNAPGGAQPNYAEVPQHLRPLVEEQFSSPLVVPTPAPGQAIRIRIPAIGVDAPVVEGVGWEQLKKGVGHLIASANPGENNNVVLSAHNDIFGELFRHLDRLAEGDEVILHTQTQGFTYRVVYWRIVQPTEISVMEPTREPIVTLISCYPYLVDNQRIVVVAELVSE